MSEKKQEQFVCSAFIISFNEIKIKYIFDNSWR